MSTPKPSLNSGQQRSNNTVNQTVMQPVSNRRTSSSQKQSPQVQGRNPMLNKVQKASSAADSKKVSPKVQGRQVINLPAKLTSKKQKLQSFHSDATMLKIGKQQSSETSKQVSSKTGAKSRAKAFDKATAKVKKVLKRRSIFTQHSNESEVQLSPEFGGNVTGQMRKRRGSEKESPK